MKKTFQLSAVAIALTTSGAVMADATININSSAGAPIPGVTSVGVIVNDTTQPGNEASVTIDANSGVSVNASTSTITSSGTVSTGANLVIPTVDPSLASTSQTFSQDRVDTQDQTRIAETQVIDNNKFQLTSSNQQGQQTWTTSQTATAEYDASGVIIPGSIVGPTLGTTVDNGFAASVVSNIQDLTLGRNNSTDDYALTITKTDTGVTNTTEVAADGITTSRIIGNGTNGALVLSGGTSTTTQTLDDNGVSFVTTQPGTGIVTGTTTIDANGHLTVESATVTGDFSAGASTLDSLTVTNTTTLNGLLTANAGANVIGGLTADTATLNGLLTANAGANVIGGLTADTATLNGLLTANAGANVIGGLTADTATLNGLLTANAGANVIGGLTADTATLNGLLTANAGANVIGGLTADTATVTGTLTTEHIVNNTLASNRVQAPTIVLAERDAVTQADGTLVVTNQFNPSTPTANRLTGLYDVSGVEVYELYVNGLSTPTYYVNNGGVFTEYTGDIAGIQAGLYGVLAGGTTQNTVGTQVTGIVKNVITDRNVTYSEAVSSQEATEIDGSLNNGFGDINATIGTGVVTTVEQSVVSGIIDTQNGLNTYGVEVSRTDANGTATTTVTAGAVSTGAVTADTIVVGGKNVADEFSRLDGEVNRLDGRVDAVDARVTTEVNRLDGEVVRLDSRVDAVDARVTTEVNRLDGEVVRLDGRIDTVAADTLTSAKSYTDDKVAVEKSDREAADATLQANIDTEAATRKAADDAATTDRAAIRDEFAAADATLQANIDTEAATRKAADDAATTDRAAIRNEAAAETTRVNKAIVDGNAATLAAANTYTDNRVNAVSKKLDAVEKTAYRGVAIALAAQQAVPNIKPGQVALFGGVGHYEGETAGSVGVVAALNDRLSATGAIGFADGSQFGGRVGIAYVFGGN